MGAQQEMPPKFQWSVLQYDSSKYTIKIYKCIVEWFFFCIGRGVMSDRKAIEPYDPDDLHEHELSFDEIVYKGYDGESENNKKVTMSLRHYPIWTYHSYNYILNHSEDYSVPWRLKFIGDVQVYSSKLGIAIIQNLDIYHEIAHHYANAFDSTELYIMSSLESATNFTFNNVFTRQRSFKTLYYIHEEIQKTANMVGLYPSSLIVLASIAGLLKTKLPQEALDNLNKEHNKFLSHLGFVAKKYESYSKY